MGFNGPGLRGFPPLGDNTGAQGGGAASAGGISPQSLIILNGRKPIIGGVGWHTLGDSLGSNSDALNMWRDYIGFAQNEIVRSGFVLPTSIVRHGVVGITSTQFAPGGGGSSVTIQTAAVANGDCMFFTIGTNDPSNGINAATTIANIKATLDYLTTTFPLSPIVIGTINFVGSENWTIAGQKFVGTDNGTDIQVRNAAIKAAVSSKQTGQYLNVQFVDLYSDLYAYAGSGNPTNSTTYLADSAELHPSDIGAKCIGRSCLRQLYQAFRDILPDYLLPESQDGGYFPDLFGELRSWMTSYRNGGGSTGGVGIVSPFARFDFREINLWNNNGFAAGSADANVEGGALLMTPAAAFTWGPTIAQALLTVQASLHMLVTFPQPDAVGRDSLIGYTDAAGNNALQFGKSHTGSATNWVVREHATTDLYQVSAVAHDVNRHLVSMIFDGGKTLGGTLIYDVILDTRTSILHVNPTAKFPAVPLAFGMVPVATGGQVIIERAIVGYQRART